MLVSAKYQDQINDIKFESFSFLKNEKERKIVANNIKAFEELRGLESYKNFYKQEYTDGSTCVVSNQPRRI